MTTHALTSALTCTTGLAAPSPSRWAVTTTTYMPRLASPTDSSISTSPATAMHESGSSPTTRHLWPRSTSTDPSAPLHSRRLPTPTDRIEPRLDGALDTTGRQTTVVPLGSGGYTTFPWWKTRATRIDRRTFPLTDEALPLGGLPVAAVRTAGTPRRQQTIQIDNSGIRKDASTAAGEMGKLPQVGCAAMDGDLPSARSMLPGGCGAPSASPTDPGSRSETWRNHDLQRRLRPAARRQPRHRPARPVTHSEARPCAHAVRAGEQLSLVRRPSSRCSRRWHRRVQAPGCRNRRVG